MIVPSRWGVPVAESRPDHSVPRGEVTHHAEQTAGWYDLRWASSVRSMRAAGALHRISMEKSWA